VHAVLDLETDRAVAEEDEPFEEGLRKAGARCLLVHDRWSELRVVCEAGDMSESAREPSLSKERLTSDHDELLDAERERDHALGLGLRGERDGSAKRSTETKREKYRLTA
jgi:hypothetical protein